MEAQTLTESLRLERRDNDIAILWVDVPGENANMLREGIEEEFDRAIDAILSERGIRGVVIASGKKDSFIVGADVKMLQRVHGAREAEQISRRAQRAMDRIESLPMPTVAAIHGPCAGGGLELALACNERIASEHEKTSLGLPEVMLGVIPGAGGTWRLPQTIGVERALELILTGKMVPAGKARSMGLVDEVVHPAILVDAAVERAEKLAEAPDEIGIGKRARQIIGSISSVGKMRSYVLEDLAPGRAVVFSQARKQTMSRTHGNMPAPLRAIDVIETGLSDGREAGMNAEAEAFGTLAVSPEARALMALFLAREELKRERGADAEPREIRKLGVLGAGLMGGGIAQVTATHVSIPVRLKDVEHDMIRTGLKSIRTSVDEYASKKRLLPAEVDRIMNLIRPTTDYTGFRHAGLVIEAVVEKLDVKHSVIGELQEAAGDEMIIATNTSSIPIAKIAEGSAAPERVIGMHYFSPVEKVPLLEIIVGEKTDPWVVATCVAFGKKQGKTVIVVNDGTGFYTTRILGPYMAEAAHLLAEGVAVDRIDRALRHFGFPVGPIELLDDVGIDVAHKIQEVLAEAFGDRMAPVSTIDAMVDEERLGKKSGKGFYQYTRGNDGLFKRKDGEVDKEVYETIGITPDKEPDEQEIALRCTLAMINEAVRCYDDGILRSARDGDVGAVFGMGFPPFLGGPFRYIDRQGAHKIADRLKDFRDRFGERFEPAPLLVEMGRDNRRFYSDDAPAPGGRGRG
jgi:3-hydroxyacyl-CoA dehydrogenase / enoyl-CoA hydratase / 3-hydroxybutyryl-CoA epimerase